jgi:hypothetical protein
VNAPSQRLINLFGNPAGKDGKVNQKWYVEHITSVDPPFPLFYDGKPVRSVRVHVLVAQSFQKAMSAIPVKVRAIAKEEYGYEHDSKWYDAKVAELIHTAGVDLWGGSYEFRKMRGSDTISNHSLAIAIDSDPGHNALGTEGRYGRAIRLRSAKKTLDISDRVRCAVVDSFEEHGWTWGGRFKRRKDPMHFEKTSL